MGIEPDAGTPPPGGEHVDPVRVALAIDGQYAPWAATTIAR